MRIVDGCEPGIVYAPDPALSPDDPWIAGRLVREDGRPGNVSTHYRARAEPAPGYPASLPFVPGVEVHVTVHADSRIPAGARWIGDAPDAVLAAVVADTEASGWVATPLRPPMADVAECVAQYERDGITRHLLKVSRFGFHMIQLLDVPTAWS